MSKEVHVIGIDHGNSQIKTRHTVFPSGVVSYGKQDPGTEDVLEYNGEYYVVSTKHGNIERDKTETDRYYILTLFAIAKELNERKVFGGTHNVILAIGLPPGHMNKRMNDKYKAYFSKPNPVQFKYNNEKYTITIQDISVVAQGMGAVVYTKSNIHKRKRFVVLDIGGGTVEYIVVQNGKVDPDMCRSIAEGTITIASEIAKDVSTQFDLDLREDDIYDTLNGEETLLPHDTKEFIKEAYRKKAIHYINQMRDFGMDPKIWYVFLTGGGAKYVKEYFTKENRIEYVSVEGDVKANAIGFEMLAEQKLKAQKTASKKAEK